VPPNTHRALTVAGEELRLFLLKDGKLREQKYDLTGAPRGGPAELATPRSQQPSGLLWTLQAVVLLVMILVMLVTLYRRRAAQQQPRQEDQAE
jgi:cytochrome c-type biogenesis protein CcmH/NrfF